MGFDPDAFTQEARENWDRAAPNYDKISADFFAPLTAALLAYADLRPGQRVLDVACGPGTATRGAAAAVGRAGQVVGVDLSAAMLKLAGEKATAESWGTVEFREMNAEELDFPEETFDRTICQLGLMLFARPDKALREMARVTKTDGMVCCLVQGSPEKMLFTSLLMRTLMKHAPELKIPGAPTLYAFAGPGVLEKALIEAGLTLAEAKRLEGRFSFASPEEYWKRMTEGAGKTGAMLRSLPEPVQAAVKRDVLAGAAEFQTRGRLEIPYEVVIARAKKPAKSPREFDAAEGA